MGSRAQSIIARKRDGHELSETEVEAFINGVLKGDWTGGQIGAMLMAILLRGLGIEETAVLTRLMRQSGDQLSFDNHIAPVADKHSTGGVGDKVSLVLAPLAASCGLAIPMLSGRGLGHTGGTLDKLEAIPGYRTQLSCEAIQAQVREIGCAIAGQTASIVPADRILYAMRDETGTVESLPLITASILSKKLAEDLDVLLLDVKFGAGAFMANETEAEALGKLMVELGKASGCRVEAWLTRMDAPLGRAVGNAVEVAECVEILKSEGSERLTALICDLVAGMLILADGKRSWEETRETVQARLDDGSALAKFREMVTAQGADPAFIDDLSQLPQAPIIRDLLYEETTPAYVAAIDAREVAMAVLELDAGRKTAADEIDHATGISELVEVGDFIHPGDLIARIHCRTIAEFHRTAATLHRAIGWSSSPVEVPDLIVRKIS